MAVTPDRGATRRRGDPWPAASSVAKLLGVHRVIAARRGRALVLGRQRHAAAVEDPSRFGHGGCATGRSRRSWSATRPPQVSRSTTMRDADGPRLSPGKALGIAHEVVAAGAITLAAGLTHCGDALPTEEPCSRGRIRRPRRPHSDPMSREPRALDGALEELPAIEPPAGHRMTGDFPHTVARTYALAALKGLPPAPAIAEQAGVSPRAVHKWVYTARKRGIMPPARAGGSGSHRWPPPR
jgi:hypothetical protein